MATVSIELGKNTCQHITISVTHEGETRRYAMTRSEIAGGIDKDRQFDQILKNALTNIKLQYETDWEKIKTAISMTSFKV
jgi:hypothetical protein